MTKEQVHVVARIDATKPNQVFECPKCGMFTETKARRTRWKLMISYGVCRCDAVHILEVMNIEPAKTVTK